VSKRHSLLRHRVGRLLSTAGLRVARPRGARL